MSAHTPGSLPLHRGSTTGGKEHLGQASPGQGPCWVKLLACGAFEQNRPSPSGRPPRQLPKNLLQALLPALPQAAHSAPKPGRKAFWGGPLSGLGPEPVDQLGGPHTQAKAEPHAHVCSCPLHLQRARLSQRLSGSSLAAPAALPGWEGAARPKGTLGLLLSLLP